LLIWYANVVEVGSSLWKIQAKRAIKYDSFQKQYPSTLAWYDYELRRGWATYFQWGSWSKSRSCYLAHKRKTCGNE
jgi:hypothetical protein